jgi:hypothetical protein
MRTRMSSKDVDEGPRTTHCCTDWASELQSAWYCDPVPSEECAPPPTRNTSSARILMAFRVAMTIYVGRSCKPVWR